MATHRHSSLDAYTRQVPRGVSPVGGEHPTSSTPRATDFKPVNPLESTTCIHAKNLAYTIWDIVTVENKGVTASTCLIDGNC